MQTSRHVVVSYSDTEIDYYFAFLTIEEDKFVYLSSYVIEYRKPWIWLFDMQS